MGRKRNAFLLLGAAAALAALPGCGAFKKTGKKPATMGERISVLDYEKQVQPEAELQGVEVLLPAQQVNADWTQPAGNASGSMGHLALAAQPARAWTVTIGKGSDSTRKLNAPPVVAENRLFVMDTEAQVSAYDAQGGALLWRKAIQMQGEGSRPAFGGGVSVLDGRVIATTGFGLVVAFDAGTGAELWRTRLPTPLRAAPGVDENRAYVVSQDGQLTALAADTGAQLWDANATVEPASILGAGAPAIALGTVVAGFPSGELFALRVENGRTMWQDQLSRSGRTTALGALSGITASPVIDRGRVFAVSHGGRMAALELSTGQRIWERDFAGVNAPWPAGDWVFAVTVEGELVAMSRADGKIRWVSSLGAWKNEKKRKGAIQWFGPVLAGNCLIVTSSEGAMACYTPADGKLKGEVKLGSPTYLAPVVANGTLYVLTDDGKLQAWR
ncbi:PQQ-like beta-propeller repeat protein [Sandaracinobacter sp. RS1-74]|uniref:outer membrane protein assembly factor BamB family protein n=1 Tax=Sandaracinobacteroides sayramensis TaxID=2913411 RepID=UPI001EDA46F0|nr:PQQ-like beta-propeller repeat protein [Sandaracinobacteroides sayramensis]MCG2842488.1 PQQ-like beta-propeller repeat protein [Sandaracinobacteroides sayramensis]